MRPKLLLLIERCIEEGARRGYSRAHKHTDQPSKAVMLSAIQDAIMAEFYDWFDFDLDQPQI